MGKDWSGKAGSAGDSVQFVRGDFKLLAIKQNFLVLTGEKRRYTFLQWAHLLQFSTHFCQMLTSYPEICLRLLKTVPVITA